MGFFKANSTSGEALYKLLCNAMKEFNLDMANIVAEYFDGASNMNGEYKGVATRAQTWKVFTGNHRVFVVYRTGATRNLGKTYKMSDFNRGNFLELLHLRCKDVRWLADMLQSQLGEHRQWTSTTIQNELLHT